MMKYKVYPPYIALIAGVLLFCMTCCKTPKTTIKEVTNTETVEVIKRDTITIALPKEIVTVIKKDTAVTETSVAMAEAFINDVGMISLTLKNKPFTPKVEIQYKEKVITHTEYKDVPVEVPLSKWQKVLIWSGLLFYLVIIFKLVSWARKL